MSDELVYLIQGGDYYKIGRTKNLAKRLRVIQTNHAWALKVIHTWETPESALVEKYLHCRFSDVKMYGEWFALTEANILVLQGITAWDTDEMLKRTQKPKVKIMKPIKPRRLGKVWHSGWSNFLIQKGYKRPIDFAHASGLSRQYAHLLWTGKRLISRKMARRLSPLLGVPPETLMMLEAHDPDATD